MSDQQISTPGAIDTLVRSDLSAVVEQLEDAYRKLTGDLDREILEAAAEKLAEASALLIVASRKI